MISGSKLSANDISRQQKSSQVGKELTSLYHSADYISFPLGSLGPLWNLWKWSSAHVYARGRKQCCKLHYCLWRVPIKPRAPMFPKASFFTFILIPQLSRARQDTFECLGSQNVDYRFYPEYLDTLSPSHACSNIWTTPFYYLLLCQRTFLANFLSSKCHLKILLKVLGVK